MIFSSLIVAAKGSPIRIGLASLRLWLYAAAVGVLAL
jgi:hypothetical protein